MLPPETLCKVLRSASRIGDSLIPRYFQIHFQLAGLLLKITQGDRRTVLRQARLEYESYLKLIDAYDILSSADAKTFQRYLEDPNNFSEASGSDAAARRQAKISRFQEEKAITRKLEVRSLLQYTCYCTQRL